MCVYELDMWAQELNTQLCDCLVDLVIIIIR